MIEKLKMKNKFYNMKSLEELAPIIKEYKYNIFALYGFAAMFITNGIITNEGNCHIKLYFSTDCRLLKRFIKKLKCEYKILGRSPDGWSRIVEILTPGIKFFLENVHKNPYILLKTNKETKRLMLSVMLGLTWEYKNYFEFDNENEANLVKEMLEALNYEVDLEKSLYDTDRYVLTCEKPDITKFSQFLTFIKRCKHNNIRVFLNNRILHIDNIYDKQTNKIEETVWNNEYDICLTTYTWKEQKVKVSNDEYGIPYHIIIGNKNKMTYDITYKKYSSEEILSCDIKKIFKKE